MENPRKNRKKPTSNLNFSKMLSSKFFKLCQNVHSNVLYNISWSKIGVHSTLHRECAPKNRETRTALIPLASCVSHTIFCSHYSNFKRIKSESKQKEKVDKFWSKNEKKTIYRTFLKVMGLFTPGKKVFPRFVWRKNGEKQKISCFSGKWIKGKMF